MALSISVEADITTDVGRRTREGVRRFLEDGADRGHAEALDRVPVDRGTLQQALASFDPTWEDGALRYGVQDLPYARAQEWGTDGYYPPLEPLLEWSERVTGSKGLGYYVARVKIPEEGITAHPYMTPARERQKSWYKSHSISEYVKEEF